MRRREFLGVLGGAAAPIVVHGQQAAKLPTIAFWVQPHHLTGAREAAFVERLRDLVGSGPAPSRSKIAELRAR